MKRSLAWCGLLVVALSSVAAVAVGSEAGERVRQSLDDKPLIKTLAASRLVRVSLDKKAQPLRTASPRRIVASLDTNKVTYVGSGTVKRRIRETLDDTNYLGAATKAPAVPTLAFPRVEEARTTPKRVFRQNLDDAPMAASLAAPKPRPLRTTLD